MKKYRMYITEEIGGYIVVEAKNEEEAEEVAEDLLDEYGCDRLFFPPPTFEGLNKYHGNLKHGDREVVGCKEIK